MNTSDTKARIPLTPPTVSIASPSDGLLKTSDLENPIPVGVRVWEAAEPQYYFQLILDGQLVGNIRAITEADKVGDIIEVFLDEKLLVSDGAYLLSYMASSPFSESHVPSPEITLKVDRTKPGATLLAPLIFPTATFGDQLIGLLPGYAGMAPGDVIQTLLNGVEGPSHKVEADELTLSPVEIAFSREHLQAHAAETVSVEYFVTDRAGNVSITGLPTLVSIKL
ncbi:hypothetical protein AO263_22080 [Pseudomonas sp. NZIPFR-PS5]|nr:hypothetical protein AO263_22080 [Pseudomonas sp. NZIPFR-PS5]